jgi:hypothetical protein
MRQSPIFHNKGKNMNKTTAITAATIATVASLWGPARAEHIAKTVEWYVQHPDWRAKINRACMNNPGEAMHVPDCLNASEATQRNGVGSAIASLDRGLAQTCAGKSASFRHTYCQ